MLHIADGYSVAGSLEASSIPGEVRVYGDLLNEGPVIADLDGEAWRETRARFHAGAGYLALDEAISQQQEFEDALVEATRHEEVCLWLDHRVTDQLILLRVLDWFRRHGLGAAQLSLICLGSHPRVGEEFGGLGQLFPEELATLLDQREPVAMAQFKTAESGWAAFTAPDPTAIEEFLKTDTSALPFLAAALRRHLEEFPDVRCGLSRSERGALGFLNEEGPLRALDLYLRLSCTDHLYLDDRLVRWLMLLSLGQHPLVSADRPDETMLSTLTLLPAGREVVEGRADYIALNGIDRWLGGVHVKGDRDVWRWDAAAGRIVRV